MITPIYIGRDNLLESASLITCGQSSNEELLISRSTGRAMVTVSVATVTITITWSPSPVALSSFALHEHNGAGATTPQWRIELYSGSLGSGTLLADSGVLDMIPAPVTPPPFASPKLSTSLYTFRRTVGGLLVPDEIAARSAVITITTGAAFVWEIGYGWAGLSTGLSEWSVLGADDSATVQTRSRAVETHGGGVSFVDDVLDPDLILSLPVLNAADREALIQVYEGVGYTAPFFLHMPLAALRDRYSRGGVLRFAGKSLGVSPVGAVMGRERDLYRCETTVRTWK